MMTFNQTKMELKQLKDVSDQLHANAFNQTKMELKHCSSVFL